MFSKFFLSATLAAALVLTPGTLARDGEDGVILNELVADDSVTSRVLLGRRKRGKGSKGKGAYCQNLSQALGSFLKATKGMSASSLTPALASAPTLLALHLTLLQVTTGFEKCT
jgi:hypothetical protein